MCVGGGVLTEWKSGKKQLRKEGCSHLCSSLSAATLLDSRGSFSSPQLTPNLINSTLKEMESYLCWKVGTLQERFFSKFSKSASSTFKLTWKHYKESDLKLLKALICDID